jgi:RimJ/RimL family protein N-acetyltransferase
MGEGSSEPQPTFAITVDGRVVGWVDFDRDEREWLTHDEVNCGYHLHPDARGRGYATRALMLLVHHLSMTTDVRTATLAIDVDNRWSLAIAERCGFDDHGTTKTENDSRLFKKPVPPRTYTDGVVTIRPPTVEDAQRHLDATDEVQIHWLWPREHQVEWAGKSPAEQLEHQRQFLARTAQEWGSGPQFWFVVDVDGHYVGHVDANVANPDVPHGEANISYSCHPAERGRGYASRAAKLAIRFVTEHTGAREAHIVVHPENEASLRVARSVGAVEVDRAKMVRHLLRLR